MAQTSVKQSRVTQAVFAFDGGLNRADSPDAIADNQLVDVCNMYYEGGQNVLVTRPGLVHAAAAPPGLPDIVKLHAYVKGAEDAILIAATSDAKLYSLDDSQSPPAWNHVADLAQPGVTPCLVTFNDKLIIADGGPALRSFDGQTLTTLEGSPAATALVETGGRLAANSASDLDAVLLSAPEDETDWSFANGAALVRAGYGDGLRVTGLGVFSRDLIVFKSGQAGKRIMRLNTAGALGDWSLSHIASNLTALSPHALEFVGNNLLFADKGAIHDLGGVQQYGDIQVGGVGRPVNPVLGGKHVAEMRLVPRLGVLLVFIEGDNQVLVFHPQSAAWTRFDFQGLFLKTAAQAGDKVYLAGAGGRLYRLGLGESRDEVAPGDMREIAALARSKVFSPPGGVVLRKTRLSYEAITPSVGSLAVFGSDQVSRVDILTINAKPGLGKLGEATAALDQATQPLGASAESKAVSRARFRDQALSFQITTARGRIRLRQCLAEMAAVNG